MSSKKLGTLLRSVAPATAQATEPPEPPPRLIRPPVESWPLTLVLLLVGQNIMKSWLINSCFIKYMNS